MNCSTIKLAVCFLIFSFALASGQQSAFAQRSKDVTLENDPAIQGSRPYKEAVQNFLQKKEPKIIGGQLAEDGAYAWQVSLGASLVTDPYYAHFCGGSVYKEKWIITAAHCAENMTPSQIIVTAGTNRLVDGTTRRNARRIIVHKDYNGSSLDNDIALIELLDPLPLGDKIKAVELLAPGAEGTLLIENAALVVTGWGRTKTERKVRDLRYVDIPFVPRSICNRASAYDGRITVNMICAGERAGGKDSCQGDSGGPLTAETATRAPKLAGVVSWGDGCALPDKVGVYTRVANYFDWIQTCVSGSPNCNK
jgi:secreted trypsin-like serine protease